jgi:hypothetical protein
MGRFFMRNSKVSGAPSRHLATRYGRDSFWPSDMTRRADVDRWAEWAKLNVAMAFTVPVFWRLVRTPKAQCDKKAIEAAVEVLEKSLELRTKALPRIAFSLVKTLHLLTSSSVTFFFGITTLSYDVPNSRMCELITIAVLSGLPTANTSWCPTTN